jgi:hypothetical protein
VETRRYYSLGEEYQGIKARATKKLGEYIGDSSLVEFQDVDKKVIFTTERLSPIESTKRPHVMLLFSNPHPHSIQQGMFLSPNTKKRENLFWPCMRNAHWFSVAESERRPDQLKNIFLQVKYASPFELHFYCYYAFPTTLPSHIRAIFGERFFSQTIEPEAGADFRNTLKEAGIKAIVCFNKDIFNLVSEGRIERYIKELDNRRLVESRIKDIDEQIPIFLTYPTGWHFHENIMELRKVSLEKAMVAILDRLKPDVDQNT